MQYTQVQKPGVYVCTQYTGTTVAEHCTIIHHTYLWLCTAQAGTWCRHKRIFRNLHEFSEIYTNFQKFGLII